MVLETLADRQHPEDLPGQESLGCLQLLEHPFAPVYRVYQLDLVYQGLQKDPLVLLVLQVLVLLGYRPVLLVLGHHCCPGHLVLLKPLVLPQLPWLPVVLGLLTVLVVLVVRLVLGTHWLPQDLVDPEHPVAHYYQGYLDYQLALQVLVVLLVLGPL